MLTTIVSSSPDGPVGGAPTGSDRGYGGCERQGTVLTEHLHDIPVRAGEIALHGVRHGATVALTAVQVQTGVDLTTMETGSSYSDGPEEHEDLQEEFVMAASTIVDIIEAVDIVNEMFRGQ